jgi:rare lipoprotein A
MQSVHFFNREIPRELTFAPGSALSKASSASMPGFRAVLSGLLIMSLFSFSAMAGAEEGTASYYADSLDGNSTASGEPYDRKAMTAAHRTLPFGTMVKVTNLSNDKSVVVRINDRGPHTQNRIIDLSRAAAEKLDLLDSGTARVRIELK